MSCLITSGLYIGCPIEKKYSLYDKSGEFIIYNIDYPLYIDGNEFNPTEIEVDETYNPSIGFINNETYKYEIFIFGEDLNVKDINEFSKFSIMVNNQKTGFPEEHIYENCLFQKMKGSGYIFTSSTKMEIKNIIS